MPEATNRSSGYRWSPGLVADVVSGRGSWNVGLRRVVARTASSRVPGTGCFDQRTPGLLDQRASAIDSASSALSRSDILLPGGIPKTSKAETQNTGGTSQGDRLTGRTRRS